MELLILEALMLHHETEMEDMQVWLYGKLGGLHWPSCQKLTSDVQAKVHANSILKPRPAGIEPHAQECLEFQRQLSGVSSACTR